MASTTKMLIAIAIGSTSAYKQLQNAFVTAFSYGCSLPSDFENKFFVKFIFWYPRLSSFGKYILPDYHQIISKKSKHEKTAITKLFS